MHFSTPNEKVFIFWWYSHVFLNYITNKDMLKKDKI